MELDKASLTVNVARLKRYQQSEITKLVNVILPSYIAIPNNWTWIEILAICTLKGSREYTKSFVAQLILLDVFNKYV